MSQRNAVLDLLRGIAVLSVTISHVPSFQKQLKECNIQFPLGHAGVDLFFVLSGFLVSGLIFRELRASGTFSYKRFLIRRGFKIYPSFYFFLAATFVLSYVLKQGGNGDNIKSYIHAWYLGEALFIQNYMGSNWNHTWSLGVEEQFYLFLCLIFIIFIREADSANRIVPVVYAAIILCLIGRFVYIERVAESEHKYWNMYIATHFRIDSLLVGVWLSYHYHFHRPRFLEVLVRYRTSIKLAALFFALIFFFNSTLGLHKAVLFPMSFLCWLSVLALGLTSASLARWTSDKGIFPLRFLAIVGFYSYNIYLWHMPVIRWTELIFPWVLEIKAHLGLSLLFYTLSAILVGVVLTKLIEAPLLKIRDKRFPSLSNTQVGARPQIQ